jgi:FlaA1/EpsC-like NDP-sugar epimerase
MKRWYWVLDVATVLSFVIIGRDTHGFVTDWAVTARVAAPFLIAFGVGVLITRAWRNPTGLLTGLGLAVTTVALGLFLRRFVFDAGTARTFVILTSTWMAAWMVGWRLVAKLVVRVASNRRGSVAA